MKDAHELLKRSVGFPFLELDIKSLIFIMEFKELVEINGQWSIIKGIVPTKAGYILIVI